VCVCVCMFQFSNVLGISMCGFFNLCECVCLGFVMCWFVCVVL